MNDIENEADVRRLVDAFYGKVRRNPVLNPIFTDVAQVDWAHHLPKMYAFWNRLVLGLPGYEGTPLAAHLPLPVDRVHFERWLALFGTAVDENFSGPGAVRAKDAAAGIAHTFAVRMGTINPVAGKLL